MSFISYSIENDKIFKAALDDAKKAVSDLRIPLSLIARDFYRSQKAIFDENRTGPGKYPDLAEATKERKYKLYGFAYPILKATGKLEVAGTVRGGSGNITVVTKQSLTMGVSDSSVPYAKYHQSDRPRKKIPLRKFLFIGPESPSVANKDQMGRLERWVNTLNSFVVNSTKKALGK